MLRKWLTQPLRSVEKIKDRSTAVNDLIEHSGLIDEFYARVTKLPDFERSIGRILNTLQKQRLVGGDI